MGALQGNVQTISVFKIVNPTQISISGGDSATLVVDGVGGINPTSDTVAGVQIENAADYTDSIIPTMNATISAIGEITLWFTNASSGTMTIAAGATFKITAIRQENGFVNNSL